MQEAVDKKDVAGMNLLVLKGGREVLYHEVGYADLEAKTGYARDSINRMYSMTKPITGAAVLKLVEMGRISLIDSVDMYIPEFGKTMVYENGRLVPRTRPLTLRDLMSMSSGLLYGGNPQDPACCDVQRVYDEIEERLDGDHPMSTVEMATKLAGGGLSFQPGTAWNYGTSADVLGAVVEIASGMRFGDFLEEYFFRPLGMQDTGFAVPREKSHRMPTVYKRSEQGLIKEETRHLGMTYLRDRQPAFESGGAGLNSTLDDYGRFATMLLNGGSHEGKQILSEQTVEYMTHPEMMPWVQDSMWHSWESLLGMSYGNLVRCATHPNMAYYPTWEGEYGWDGWLGTYFCNSPKNRITILAGMQLVDAGALDLMFRLRAALMQDRRLW